jgi:CBS domain containing-hemolysin-like protein
LEDSRLGLRIALLVFFILCSAFFSVSETALFSANRVVLRQRRAQGDRRARTAYNLLNQASELLTTILAGSTMATIAATVVSTSIALTLVGRGGEWVAFLGTTAVVLILAEIGPKTLAARHADRLALAIAGPISTLMRVFTPLIRVLSLIATTLIRPFGGHITPRAPLVTEEQLRFLVEVSEEEGVIEEKEREMIHSIFEFGDTVVREVMRPRVDIVAAPAEATVNGAIGLMAEHGHSRLPVFEGTIDHIVGVVYMRDLIPALRQGRLDLPVSEVRRPAFFVPETKKVDELFKEMQQRKVSMAIVLDEFGGTAGLVTVEDLLEEIVGEIQDEYDLEEKPIQLLDANTALVNARIHVEEINELLGTRLPQEDVDTVAGLVYSLFGRVPSQGEQVTLPGVELKVEKTLGQRITRVRITRTTSAPQEEAAPL